MDRLTGVEELLDGPLDDTAALVTNLRDLARLNRLSGGAALSWRAVDALGGAATLLDVGTGGADIPLALLAEARKTRRSLDVTAVDSRAEVLAAAGIARRGIERAAGLHLALADGRSLPFDDASFDVAHASLVVHHLERDAAVAFLRELRRVARRGIVVNDLVRGWTAWIGTWLLVHSIARGTYTRHDGPLSIRRAYDRSELDELVRAAGMRPVATFSGVGGRRVAIAAR